MKTIDLRSDTVTRPSPEMRAAMLEAEVGDDVLGDDPTVHRACRSTPRGLLGKEAGAVLPVRHHVQPGGGPRAHAARRRGLPARPGAHRVLRAGRRVGAQPGAAARASTPRTGRSTSRRWRSTSTPTPTCTGRPRGWCASSRRTTTAAASCVPLEHILAVREFCDRHGLMMHLDGARLFNAVAATGVSAAEYAAPFDTVSICLSKGLGAPVGSVLVMDAATLPAAARARKVLRRRHAPGGHHRRRRAVRAAAQRRAAGRRPPPRAPPGGGAGRAAGAGGRPRQRCRPTWCSPAPAGPGVPAAELVERLAAEGVLCLDEAPWSVRFVTHLDVDDEGVEQRPSAASSASPRGLTAAAALALRRPAGYV